MSNMVTPEAGAAFEEEVGKRTKGKKLMRQPNDKDRIEKLEKDLRAVVNMLNSMSSAIGLPKSIIPDLD